MSGWGLRILAHEGDSNELVFSYTALLAERFMNVFYGFGATVKQAFNLASRMRG